MILLLSIYFVVMLFCTILRTKRTRLHSRECTVTSVSICLSTMTSPRNFIIHSPFLIFLSFPILPIIFSPYFYSGGCDQRIHRFDMEGEVLDSWSISPIASSIQSVNPPFVQRLARSHDGSLFFGCTDGTIRCLGKKDDYPVVMTHLYSISDVCIWILI